MVRPPTPPLARASPEALPPGTDLAKQLAHHLLHHTLSGTPQGFQCLPLLSDCLSRLALTQGFRRAFHRATCLAE